MTDTRYGNTRIGKIKAAYDDLRMAIRSGDMEAANAALDRVRAEERRKGMEAAAEAVRACAPHIELDSTQEDRMHESIIERAARHIETAMNGDAS